MVKSLLRIATFFGRWAAELSQQPALVLSLIAGPFFILLSFGAGIRATPPEPTVIVVADERWRAGEELAEELHAHFNVAGVTTDQNAALRMLHDRQADAVLVMPNNPEAAIEQGTSAEVLVFVNYVDPALNAYAHTYLLNQVYGLNNQATKSMVRDAQEETRETRASLEQVRQRTALLRGAAMGEMSESEIVGLEEQFDRTAAGLERFNNVSPELIASPFDLEMANVAQFDPSYTAFYGPAVLVLLLQHLAVTMGALTLTRIRLLGVMDLLRVSPVRPTEMVLGHYLSYAVLCGLAGAALTALLVFVLNVPLFGSLQMFAGAVTLLVLSSLGVGFVIASISSSEQQSAQIAMLVLLTSIFFSGLLFPLGQIAWPAQAISYVLPATYGIRSVQDIMLRGDLQPLTDLAVLGGGAVVLFALTVLLLRREWRPD